jgi:hypothetical protein
LPHFRAKALEAAEIVKAIGAGAREVCHQAYWETIYAISNERSFSLRTLYAIGAAFSGISPWRALGLGVIRALRHEARRLHRHLPPR